VLETLSSTAVVPAIRSMNRIIDMANTVPIPRGWPQICRNVPLTICG
jgi:hypothetical protein